MDKLLVLGGKPIASCDIVDYANRIGVYTVVTDYLSDEMSPAKRIAKEAWNISTAEVDRLCDKIKEEKITAVFTGAHEFNISKTIEICERLNLNFYTSSKVYNCLSNKEVYKTIFEHAGMPKIREFYKGDYRKIDYNNIVYPVVVKPVDGSGGFGVKKCFSISDFRENATLAGQASNRGEVLIEECMLAPEVTIFYIIRNGKILVSAMGDRITHSFDDNVIPLPVLYTFPSKHLDSYMRQFDEKVVAALTSVGVKNGMLFIQAFWKDDKCYIYDIGYRLTGTQEYNLLSVISGYNPLEMLVDFSLTGQMGTEDIQYLVDPFFNGKKAAIVTLLMYPGTIHNFRGVETVAKMDGVVKFVLNHEVGETIPESALGTLVQVAARAFVVASSMEELQKIVGQVRNSFSVIGKNGEILDIKVD